MQKLPINTLEGYELYSLARLQFIDRVKTELLEQYQMLLKTKRGVGYEIVRPKHQTMHAMHVLKNEVSKMLKKTSSALLNINKTELSQTEKKANADAIAKLAALKSAKKTQLLK